VCVSECFRNDIDDVVLTSFSSVLCFVLLVIVLSSIFSDYDANSDDAPREVPADLSVDLGTLLLKDYEQSRQLWQEYEANDIVVNDNKSPQSTSKNKQKSIAKKKQ
jgi:hypothetical protein